MSACPIEVIAYGHRRWQDTLVSQARIVNLPGALDSKEVVAARDHYLYMLP